MQPILPNVISVLLVCLMMLSLSLGCDSTTQPSSEKPPAAQPTATPTPGEKTTATRVMLETSMGNILIELNEHKAPLAVKNFLIYVDEDFFNDTIVHRVIPNFMIQAGGISTDLQQKPSHPPIKNEAPNDLQNKRATVAMGQKSGDPDSATSHFFINLIDNTHLDYQGPAQPGYTVFGKVIDGMDTVDKIAAVKTTTRGPYPNTPVEPVMITSAQRANP